MTLVDPVDCFEIFLRACFFQLGNESINFHFRLRSSITPRIVVVVIVVAVLANGTHLPPATWHVIIWFTPSISETVQIRTIHTSIHLIKTTRMITTHLMTLTPPPNSVQRRFRTRIINTFGKFQQLLRRGLFRRIQYKTIAIILTIQMTQLHIITGILFRKAAVGRLTHITTLKRTELCNVFHLARGRHINHIIHFVTIPPSHILHVIQMLT
mmetsp:Transcript_21766/g.34138  ORF Transcript_21766/g.34138 Transcript_21766/m.34138 type:complete len:212 (+) Transcript_21766:210-845(+)